MPKKANPLTVLAIQHPAFAEIASRVGSAVTTYISEGQDDTDKATRLMYVRALLKPAVGTVLDTLSGN